jgi:hypothetical protein
MGFFSPSSFLFPWKNPPFFCLSVCLAVACIRTHPLSFCPLFFLAAPLCPPYPADTAQHGKARHTRHTHTQQHQRTTSPSSSSSSKCTTRTRKKTSFLIPRNLERTKNGAGATHGGFLFIHQGGWSFLPYFLSYYFVPFCLRDWISLFYYYAPPPSRRESHTLFFQEERVSSLAKQGWPSYLARR